MKEEHQHLMMYTRPERKGLVGEATCLSDEEGKRCVCVHSIVCPLNKRCIQTLNFLCADACMQTQACVGMQTQTHTHGQMQMHAKPSATFHVQVVICLGLESLSPPDLVACQDPEVRLTVDQLFPKPHPPNLVLRTSVSLGGLL